MILTRPAIRQAGLMPGRKGKDDEAKARLVACRRRLASNIVGRSMPVREGRGGALCRARMFRAGTDDSTFKPRNDMSERPDLERLTDSGSLSHYGRDWTRFWTPDPDSVVFPRSTEDV